ncbi:MAG: GNAT family N-acetyltransferase [Propionibacteriales bacterium]|nr:GNAT family N-acetyltransferase [Propionibacteriales bacterium]
MDHTRSIRPATDADIAALQDIESAADSLFDDVFGPEPFGPDSAEDGAARAATKGFLLVVAEKPGGPPIGFAHVLQFPQSCLSGTAHLEQVAVRPEHLRRGHGRALVEASCTAAAERGITRVTLRTYADIEWNRPFYESCGFEVTAAIDATPYREMERVEAELGLARHGARVLMARELSTS